MKKAFRSALALMVCVPLLAAGAQQKIYWGDSVPKGWNGSWPAKLLTIPEKTKFERTASSYEILEFIDALKWSSDKVFVINMFTTPLRKTGAAAVLARPRIATPEEAAKS